MTAPKKTHLGATASRGVRVCGSEPARARKRRRYDSRGRTLLQAPGGLPCLVFRACEGHETASKKNVERLLIGDVSRLYYASLVGGAKPSRATTRPYRLVRSRTPGFHPGNWGSNPHRVNRSRGLRIAAPVFVSTGFDLRRRRTAPPDRVRPEDRRQLSSSRARKRFRSFGWQNAARCTSALYQSHSVSQGRGSMGLNGVCE